MTRPQTRSQRSLWEGDWPRWNSLPPTQQQPLREVLSQIVLDALQHPSDSCITNEDNREDNHDWCAVHGTLIADQCDERSSLNPGRRDKLGRGDWSSSGDSVERLVKRGSPGSREPCAEPCQRPATNQPKPKNPIFLTLYERVHQCHTVARRRTTLW